MIEYPDSYTEKEIEIFNLSDMLKEFRTIGKVCNAGYNAGTISPAGNVQPCTAFDEYLGNVYYNIKFNNKLCKCPVDYCSCRLSIDSDLFMKAVKACGHLED